MTKKTEFKLNKSALNNLDSSTLHVYIYSKCTGEFVFNKKTKKNYFHYPLNNNIFYR